MRSASIASLSSAAVRLRLDAGAGSNLSKWVTAGELLDWYADRMARDRSLSSKRKKTGASLIKCHLKPRLGSVPLTGIDKATLDDQFMWPAQESIGIDYVRSAFQLLALAFRQAFKLRLITTNPMKDIKFSDFSKAKVGIKPSRLRGTQLQDLMTRLLCSMANNPSDGLLGQGEWTSHDLRKLARTGWADIGIDHLIGELLINHAMGHNVKVYIQSDVMARTRDALEKWHGHLDTKGFDQIHMLTGCRFGDSGNALEAAPDKGCDPIHESTIGEV